MKLHFFGDTVLDQVYKLSFDPEFFVLNLETPLSCEGTPALHKVNICQERSYIVETFKSRPLALSLANNHVMDFGEEAFLKTIDTLKAEGIPYFGAGLADEKFNNPAIIEFAGKRIALCGYSCPSVHAVFGDETHYGSARLDIDLVCKEIEDLKSEVDFIVIQPHWGIQEIPFPTFQDREIAHQLIDAGADIVIGHHAHVIQSHEIYNGKHIFYGLGNFIFPDLDVPTRYDGSKFTDRRIKKQEIEHRRSMIVTIDEAFEVDFFTVELRGTMVEKKEFALPNWLPSCEASFQARLKREQKHIRIRNFLRNPRVPNLGHLKRLLR
jgi:poly-gamma-glutamate synthesis protein (capsule biosynthesis protein)